jgi:hypothetical protein
MRWHAPVEPTDQERCMVIRSIPLIAFFVALVVSAPARAERTVADDVQAIEHVMDAFQAALIHKDKAAYMDLFFSDNPPTSAGSSCRRMFAWRRSAKPSPTRSRRASFPRTPLSP